MIVYHGSIKRFERFNMDKVVQKLPYDIDTIGFWFTSDIQAAKANAIGTKTVIEKSQTEFWEDGEPKVIQVDKAVSGFVYKVYIDEPNLKEYKSNEEDSFDLFMKERNQFCDYLGSHKRKRSWKNQTILLNKEEANTKFRQSLLKQGFDGFAIRNTKVQNTVSDLYCIFSGDALHITELILFDALEKNS